MKILLDECVTKRLKPLLSGYEVFTVQEMNWGGIKNGELMKRCIAFEFDVLLTIDKNLINQQNLEKYSISIAIFNTFSSKIEELKEFIPAFMKEINHFEKHKAYLIERS